MQPKNMTYMEKIVITFRILTMSVMYTGFI
jgi:hypothetical protein